MNATLILKPTEKLTNHTIRISFFNRHGTKITTVRKSRQGVPLFNRKKLAAMTLDQREAWFIAKTKNCNLADKAKIRQKLDKLRTCQTKLPKINIFIYDLVQTSQKKLERTLRLIRKEQARRKAC